MAGWTPLLSPFAGPQFPPPDEDEDEEEEELELELYDLQTVPPHVQDHPSETFVTPPGAIPPSQRFVDGATYIVWPFELPHPPPEEDDEEEEDEEDEEELP